MLAQPALTVKLYQQEEGEFHIDCEEEDHLMGQPVRNSSNVLHFSMAGSVGDRDARPFSLMLSLILFLESHSELRWRQRRKNQVKCGGGAFVPFLNAKKTGTA